MDLATKACSFEEICERIGRIILEQELCSSDVIEGDILPESRVYEDLGLDSLGFVELALELEKEFSVEIADDDWEGVFTIGQIARVVLAHMG